MKDSTFSTTLSQKKEIADHILELRFTKPDGFDFQAGQFIQFIFTQDDKIVKRSYSISSTPTDDYLEFCVKILPDGIASEHFLRMNEDDELTFLGPRGRFVINPLADAHFFVATGAGIAPIMGILQDQIKNKKNPRDMELLFGVRSQKDVFWKDRIISLLGDTYSHTLTISRPTDAWKGRSGRVTTHLPSDCSTQEFYLCGSPQMVMEVRKIAISRGAFPKNIHFEIF